MRQPSSGKLLKSRIAPVVERLLFERTIVDKAMLQLDLQLTLDGHTTTRIKNSYQRRTRDIADARKYISRISWML